MLSIREQWWKKYEPRKKEWAREMGDEILNILGKSGNEVDRGYLLRALGVSDSSLDKGLQTIRRLIYTVQAGKSRWYGRNKEIR